ncbi:hypothetical protein [Synechococcus sp. MU1655]|uniref:hypothetical protein n=1 Tax=Synechococcus sp. MU1655 TaxID=2508355 RepID=UPI0020264A74|nr:hypothetical protein [Synechococcus sp. MU1655]
MNNLLLQLAIAALGQMSGGGLSQTPFNIPSRPFPIRRQVQPVYPTRSSQASNLQVATLATTTCLMRSGSIERAEALTLLERQGQTWGWPRTWGQRIPLSSLDDAIHSAGGCTALLQRVREAAPARTAIIPATHQGRRYAESRSEREGFGLAPYR